MARAEKFIIDKKNLKMFLDKDFCKKIESIGNIFPVSIVFINKEDLEDGKIKITPISLSHQNDSEIEKNILHIECPDSDILDEIIKKIENDK